MELEYSIVVPLKNEEENIVELIAELEPVMESLKRPWELICINDGSTDSTLHKLQELQPLKPYLRILSFDQNYGQTSCFDAGFKSARGKFIITLDGDRQNDPHDIPKLISHSANYDLVAGWRAERKDPISKKLTSKIANFIRSRVCEDGIHDTGCSLKLYRRSCLEKIKLYHGMHRFLPALFKMEDFKVVEVPVNHRERMKGVTKYNFFNRSFNTIADMFAVRWMKMRRLKYKVEQEW